MRKTGLRDGPSSDALSLADDAWDPYGLAGIDVASYGLVDAPQVRQAASRERPLPHTCSRLFAQLHWV
jgi:hypothetical protein